MWREEWTDPYLPDTVLRGERCFQEHPQFAASRCVKRARHMGSHRYTSSADGRSVEWDTLIRKETFGHGNFGYICEVCGEDDYYGKIEHKEGCFELTKQVVALRAGKFTKS